MHRERLQILLDEVFPAVESQLSRLNLNSYYERTECGTTYCLAGFCTLNPKLKAMGLHLWSGCMMYTDHPRVLGVSALESFFDIAPAHRKALFDGASHKNHGKDLRERKAYLKLLLQEGDK